MLRRSETVIIPGAYPGKLASLDTTNNFMCRIVLHPAAVTFTTHGDTNNFDNTCVCGRTHANGHLPNHV
jgi:hypothetical protein